MAINLTGPTAAVTSSMLTTATYSFTPDMANDARSKVFVVTALGGTQTGVTTHRVDKPKRFIIKRPLQYLQPSAYNQTSGKFGKVPNNVTRAIMQGAADVAANQSAPLNITADFSIPAGSASYDRANVEACVMAFIAALWDQKEEICQAIYDGIY